MTRQGRVTLSSDCLEIQGGAREQKRKKKRGEHLKTEKGEF
jgi:hypothetical protein